MSAFYWSRIPTWRDRWVYRWRCFTHWHYMRQTWLLYRVTTWWMNR